MRILIVLSILIQLAFSLSSFEAEWERFRKENSKIYASKEEELKRREIFVSNYKYIVEHNREQALGKHTFKLGMNKFGDLVRSKNFFSFIHRFSFKIKKNFFV